MKKIISLILAGTLLLTGCGGTGEKEPSGEAVTKLKIGLTGEESAVWNHVKTELAKEGIELELVFFNDYIMPNTALADGELDLNAFQTEIFFNDYLENSGADLSILGYTTLAPLGLYAGQVDKIEDITEGAKIAIPNDNTNGGRALILLQAAGLIEVDEAAGLLPTLKDITSNPLNLEIIEIAAPTIPTVLDEMAVAAINNGIAVTAGFNPIVDSVFLESVELDYISNYYNIIAVASDRLEEPALLKLLAIYQTDETKAIIEEYFKGSQIPAF